MGIAWNIVRVIIVAVTVVVAAELSKRFPRYGALVLSLPIVSMLAFLLSWFQYRDMAAVSRLAKETLILVPLSLPFFIPFVFAERLGMGFWTCFMTGVLIASLAIGGWMLWPPNN